MRLIDILRYIKTLITPGESKVLLKDSILSSNLHVIKLRPDNSPDEQYIVPAFHNTNCEQVSYMFIFTTLSSTLLITFINCICGSYIRAVCIRW